MNMYSCHRRRGLMFAAAVLCSAAALAGDETRRVEGLSFDHIDVIGSAKVEVYQGDTHQLTLRGDVEDLERKPFYIKGTRLILGENGTIARDDFGEVKYRVVLPALRELHVKGSGMAYVKPFKFIDDDEPARFSVDGSGAIKLYGLEGPQIELRIKGSGDIKALAVDAHRRLEAIVAGSGDLYIQTLRAKVAEIVVTGSGDIKVTEDGFVRTMEVNVVGSGDIDLRRVGGEVAEVNIVGSGSIELGEILESIQGAILGSGDVRYDGDPIVDTVEFGSGECRRRD